MSSQEKYEQAMALSRGQTEEDFELSRKCAADLLENHRTLSEHEYRELTSHLLRNLLFVR